MTGDGPDASKRDNNRSLISAGFGEKGRKWRKLQGFCWGQRLGLLEESGAANSERFLHWGAITMTPYRTSLLAVSLVLAVAGCINLPDIDPEKPLPDLDVRLLTPGATTYTNGTVDVSVEVANGTPETVELFAGDELIATLQSPYTFRWDTTTKPEGTYTLTARAQMGSKTFVSQMREVVVDRTPPQVVLRTPAPGAQDVSVRQPIRVTFSEPLNPASVADTTVHLSVQIDGVTVELAKTLSLSTDGSELTITPNSKPNVPNELSMALETLMDRAGNPMLSPTAWSWRCPVWLPMGGPLSRFPEGGETVITPAETPALALDLQGNPFVVWQERRVAGGIANEMHIFVQRWNGINWEPVGEAVSAVWTQGEAISWAPALEMDGTGRPVVAGYSSYSADIFITRWEGHWQEVSRQTFGPGLAPTTKPSFQLDRTGNPMVITAQRARWQDFPPPASHAYFGRWNGTEWLLTSQFGALPEEQTNVSGTVLRVGSATLPVAAWSEYNGISHADIYVGHLSVGNWTAIGGPLSAIPGATSASKPSLQLDAAENPVVAWKEFNEGGTSSNIYVQRWTGSLWEPIGNGVNSDPTIVEVDDPVLVLGGSGTPIVAWTGKSGSTSKIYVHRWANGQWVPLGSALSANPGNTWALHPSLRVDSEGVPIVAWDEFADLPSNPRTRNVYVYRFNR